MNKPIAWIWSEDGCNMGVCLDQDKQIGKQEFQDYSIPLYTHPVKELTDEKEALKSLYDAVIRYENLSPFAHAYAAESCEYQLCDAKEKAKAILRKAQKPE